MEVGRDYILPEIAMSPDGLCIMWRFYYWNELATKIGDIPFKTDFQEGQQ